MQNIHQTNIVRDEQEKKVEPFIVPEKQPALDSNLYPYIPNSYYISNPIQPQTGESFLAPTNPIGTSTGKSTWFLPPGVYNFSKFILTFQVEIGSNNGTSTLALPAAFTNTVVGAINNFYFPYIKAWEHRTQESIVLYTNSAVDYYSRMSGVLNVECDSKSGIANTRGFMEPSQRNYLNAISVYTNTDTPNATPDPYPETIGTLSQQFQALSIKDPSVMFVPYSLVTSGVTNTEGRLGPLSNVGMKTTKIISIRLGDLFSDSMYNLDRDIYCARSHTIDCTFNQLSQIGSMVKLDSVNVGVGVATSYAFQGQNIYDAIQAGGDTPAMNISNIFLITYSQGNDEISRKLKEEQEEKAIPIILPFLQIQSQPFINGGVSQTSTFRFNTQNPITNLYKLYYGLLAPDANGLSSNFNNINETKWNSTRITINNQTIRADLNLASRQDITEMCQFFKHGSLTSYRAVRYAGVYAIVFDNEPCKQEYCNEMRGLTLGPSNELTVVFSTKTINANFTHYAMAVQNRVYYMKNGQYYYSEP